MKILAISGSLRAASINSALLRTVRQLAPAGIEIDLFQGLGELPLFNPDLEANIPATVEDFQRKVAAADALLIASPEYAHGVTGSIKNALDWLVSYEPFVSKTVVVLNASARAQHADASLRETLRTMSANIIESASVCIPLLGKDVDEYGMIRSQSSAEAIVKMLANLNEAMTLLQTSEQAVFPLR
ncbi:NADPH-dependent FMN reductase [Asticcacaulis sp. 201]|uniref:NADPH-dependent FMN reductase n=1 Tax=Asticcacaulis sp. 201 TaxID=3028787 RepID=UPI002915E57B|nr:NADPH-dependent FMN reductase [Asticcacaulis sp. 201]MDV6329868.1 NADPH-dependent FMN reductase [Asticcacaulis sp. 201]